MQNVDLLKDFIEEATLHVQAVEAGLLKLEGNNDSTDIIHAIFRNVHSIKGTAGFFELAKIVELSHAMENLFGEIRDGNLHIDNEMIDILLAANDCLKNMIADVEGCDQADIADHVNKLRGALQGSKEKGAPPQPAANHQAALAEKDEGAIREAIQRGQRAYKVQVPPGHDRPELIKKAESIGHVFGSRTGSTDLLVATVLEKELVALALDVPGENINELQHDEERRKEVQPARSEAAAPAVETMPAPPAARVMGVEGNRPPKVNAEDSIRVHVTLLNDLLNLASEMVLGRNRLLRILEKHRKEIPGLNTVLQNIESITTELQEKTMQTRMQPVDKVFSKFPRIIRELANKMGKDIQLQIQGAEVELDKSIIEALGDPLTHLIRNAADHGIERPEVREESGKPRAGTIILKAYHEGGHVHIDVTDDGSGIDVENIKAKALQKGILRQEEVPLMGEREFLELLFQPGFSTAAKVTDVSGRGVGMDVVKTNIEKLGGTMEIMTSPGRGTTFRLILPLTLAIISSQIVEAEGQKFALPQVKLQGMVRVKPDDPSRRIEKIRGSEVLRFRNRLLPLVHLAHVLGLRKEPNEAQQVVRVLIIRIGSKRYGLVVDQIHDGEEILVKPVPRYMNSCRCYAGVTIMGDGRTAMILDPEGIAVKAGLRFTEESEEQVAGEEASTQRHIEQQSLLLFQCSGPEMFGIDLSLVSRVEKIRASQIEKIGDKEYIQFRGEALRVIRPENYLPVTRGKKQSQEYHVIIPKSVQHPMGMLIARIHDTMEARVEFNQEGIKAKGLLGSAILDNRIVLFINIFELFELAAPKTRLAMGGGKKGRKKRTILLVEDTPFFAKMEKKYLEGAGHHVLMAPNGKEALKMLRENNVDAVVSDIEMPEMDGLELVRRIRSDQRLARLPVIALTSRSDERSIRKGMEAGFDFYEIKLDKERLLEKLKLALQKRGEVG